MATEIIPAASPPAPPKEYNQQFLVPGSWFHGVHGLAFNKDDQLFAGSVVGQTIYRVQVDSGEVDRVIDDIRAERRRDEVPIGDFHPGRDRLLLRLREVRGRLPRRRAVEPQARDRVQELPVARTDELVGRALAQLAAA